VAAEEPLFLLMVTWLDWLIDARSARAASIRTWLRCIRCGCVILIGARARSIVFGGSKHAAHARTHTMKINCIGPCGYF
jgi:hypothetical protein